MDIKSIESLKNYVDLWKSLCRFTNS